MSSLDPAASIATCERALRQLLHSVIASNGGPDLERWAGSARIEQWKERAEVEAKKRQPRGVATTSSDLLDYSNLFDLIAMCEKDWGRVAPALGKSKEVLAMLKRLDDLRNTIAHGRELVPFEKDLVAGLAGDIRNRVTIYMSTQDPGGDYYPRIESVTDEFGNVVDGAATLTSDTAPMQAEQTLHEGDTVRFTCHATDAQGRQLRWALRHTPDSSVAIVADGNDVEIEWTIGPRAVAQRSSVLIAVTAVDATYHRWDARHDGQVIFFYRVLPPRR